MEIIDIQFIKELKQQILATRYQAAKLANAEMLKLYYNIGMALEKKFEREKWGSKILDRISDQLQQELPGLRGFSARSMSKMRGFYQAWNFEQENLPSSTAEIKNTQNSILPSLTDKLGKGNLEAFLSVSFTHHYEIITQIKQVEDRLYYINKVAASFWSVRHLVTELKNKSHLKEQNQPNNFPQTLSTQLSNKAIQTFKDEYLLDFINVEDPDDEIDERVLEQSIVLNIKKFLMSLGNDFSFLGNQYRLNVQGDDYFIDLLFFHRGLQSLIAFELKRGKFKPEYVGKMNFYLSVLDDLVKQEHENPSIGIILCKNKDDKKVEYSFRDFSKPMGVSIYKTMEKLPKKYKEQLPDPEMIKKLLD
jgi:predicted nuclease of restriction endonuclease-like (RecB) superfamily